ncbi:MAG: DM13 domain-containing protein [Alphaproteobacteria bacterium]
MLPAVSLAAAIRPGAAYAFANTLIGVFRDGDPIHRGSGWCVIQKPVHPDIQTALHMHEMEVVPGPNLHVYLVKEPDPLFPEDVTAAFFSLGRLKSLTGSQTYPIPPEAHDFEWGSVVVWCETFETAFAVATLKQR